MALWDKLLGLVNEEQHQLIDHPIPATRVDNAPPAVPRIPPVPDIAAPLAEGVPTLVGGGGLPLGYHNSWVGAGGAGTVLSPGYFAVIRSTDAALRNRLLVVNDELYEGASLADPAR